MTIEIRVLEVKGRIKRLTAADMPNPEKNV